MNLDLQLEDAHLAALLKVPFGRTFLVLCSQRTRLSLQVKKASLSVAELELAMAKITATINDYTTALKRAQACSQKSVPVNESTKTAFESLQKEVLCNRVHFDDRQTKKASHHTIYHPCAADGTQL